MDSAIATDYIFYAIPQVPPDLLGILADHELHTNCNDITSKDILRRVCHAADMPIDLTACADLKSVLYRLRCIFAKGLSLTMDL